MSTIKIGGRPSVAVGGGPKIEDTKSTDGAIHTTSSLKSVSLTGDGQVGVAGPCIYFGYIVTTALSAASINVRDATSAGTGTIVDIVAASAAAGTQNRLPQGVLCSTGCYADFGGTGTVTFFYKQL